MPAECEFVPACCAGEKCKTCGLPAARKVQEVVTDDDPHFWRHGLAAYLCLSCFDRLMRPEPYCAGGGD